MVPSLREGEGGPAAWARWARESSFIEIRLAVGLHVSRCRVRNSVRESLRGLTWARRHEIGCTFSARILARTGFPYTVFDGGQEDALSVNNFFGPIYAVPSGVPANPGGLSCSISIIGSISLRS